MSWEPGISIFRVIVITPCTNWKPCSKFKITSGLKRLFLVLVYTVAVVEDCVLHFSRKGFAFSLFSYGTVSTVHTMMMRSYSPVSTVTDTITTIRKSGRMVSGYYWNCGKKWREADLALQSKLPPWCWLSCLPKQSSVSECLQVNAD